MCAIGALLSVVARACLINFSCVRSDGVPLFTLIRAGAGEELPLSFVVRGRFGLFFDDFIVIEEEKRRGSDIACSPDAKVKHGDAIQTQLCSMECKEETSGE